MFRFIRSSYYYHADSYYDNGNDLNNIHDCTAFQYADDKTFIEGAQSQHLELF